jgi:hypothetical protein
MKAFHCTCGQPLFFDNSRCLGCGSEVAYEPATRILGPIHTPGDGLWTMAGDTCVPAQRYRLCMHRAAASACNWLIPAERPDALCVSCRLTRTIPDLSRPRNTQRLAELEAAKRRVLFVVQSCGLPVVTRFDDPVHGIAFDFLETLPDQPPVMTGHADGLITINVAEADDDYREYFRESLKEPYRTVVGHLRHELGHYYWDRLIRDSHWLVPFRDLFGDERSDYSLALQQHYRDGAPADWRDRFISSYAASHPWEDWAETWAHYLHLRATLQTVDSFGLSIAHTRLQVTPFAPDVLFPGGSPDDAQALLDWINAWVVLTAVLNETARSMGQPDVYPFVMNRAAVTKLHFVQCVIGEHVRDALPPPPATLQPGIAASR